MLHAIREDGARSSPQLSGEIGVCPSCLAPVRGKRGVIVVPHWAHIADDCDAWSEPETEWHARWKLAALDNHCNIEVPITSGDEKHRADAVLPSGVVLEFQHSPIPVEQMARRERFYGCMHWIFDVSDAFSDGRLDLRDRGAYHSFRWKHPKKHIALARRRVYLDIGDGGLLRLATMYPDAPCGGWGHLVGRDEIFAGAP